MAAANACDSEVLLAKVEHGTFQYGVAVAVSYELSIQDVVVRGEGFVGPSCRAIVGADLVAVVNFLVKPAQESDTGPADLKITTYQGDGGTRLHTLKNMVTRGFSYSMQRESPPAMYTQSFVHVGNMSAGTASSPRSDEVLDMTNVTVA
jgi:hypothetical protein